MLWDDRIATLALERGLEAGVAVALQIALEALEEFQRSLRFPRGRVVERDEVAVADVAPHVSALDAFGMCAVEHADAGVVRADHERREHALADVPRDRDDDVATEPEPLTDCRC